MLQKEASRGWKARFGRWSLWFRPVLAAPETFREEYWECGNGRGTVPEALAHYAGAGGEICVASLLYRLQPPRQVWPPRSGRWRAPPRASAFLSGDKPKPQLHKLRDKMPALRRQGEGRGRGGSVVGKPSLWRAAGG